ncbi:MAG: cytochrome c [Gaiella sp.]|nr:cytochrome c [Gaiella sp.]
MGAVVWVTGTQEVEEAHASEAAGGGSTTETPSGTETSGETTTEAPAAAGDAEAGKQVFESAGCAACHTLADAGATGTVGPSLDQTKPSAAVVVDLVTNGRGAMPPFADKLSETQIQDVAAYVSSAAAAS